MDANRPQFLALAPQSVAISDRHFRSRRYQCVTKPEHPPAPSVASLGGAAPPDPPNQRIKNSNDQMIDHGPPRTARTKLKLPLKPVLTTPLLKPTPHALPELPRVVDDQ